MIALKVQLLKTKEIYFIGSKVASRKLFDDRTLQLTAYRQNRIDAQRNVEMPERFKWELITYVQNVKPLEFAHLKHAHEVLVHLIDQKSQDTDLLQQTLGAMTRFPSIAPTMQHTIGNLTMKALHVINDTNSASRFILDPKLGPIFFSGFISTLLYYDMLYKKGAYEQIVMDSEFIQQFREKSISYARFIDVLVLGSYHKLNTPESFNHAYALWKNIEKKKPFERSVAFMATLALNQNKLDIALTTARALPNDTIGNQIHLLVLVEMGHMDEVIEMISSMCDETGETLCSEVVERIEKVLDSSASAQNQSIFRDVYAFLIAEDRISPKTLSDLLDLPISKSLRGKRSSPPVDEINGELGQY